MKENIISLRKLCLASLLLASNIIFINISSFFLPPGLPFCRIGLGPSMVIFASILTGPFYGAMVGALGDVLAILLRGDAGNINPFITLVYALLGIFPYFFYQASKKGPKWLTSKPLLITLSLLAYIGSMLVINVTDLLPVAEGDLWWVKLTLSIVLTIIFIGAFVGFYFLARKKDQEIYHSFFTCLLSEILFMVLAKALAFYYFYNFLAGSSMDFGYLFYCLALIAPVNILLNTYVIFALNKLKARIMGEMENESKEKEVIEEASSLADDNENLLVDEPIEKRVPWGWIIFFGVVVTAMIVCLIVIFIL